MRNGRRLFFGVLAATACALCVPAGLAGPWIDMGLKDDAAFSQPMVTFELFHQLPGGARGSSMGPDGDPEILFFPDQFILDTGATSIIAMNSAVDSLENHGYVVVNQVEETGVNGTQLVDVSDAYYVEVRGSDGSVSALPSTRIISGQFPDIAVVNGIVGMPAMVGKVVTLDNSHWTNIGPIEDIEDLLDALAALTQEVDFSTTLPAPTGNRYSVPIHAKEFPLTDPGELPASSPLAYVEMTAGSGGLKSSGDFVLDTGASMSFISSEIATNIGLDSNGDGLLDHQDDHFFDYIPIGGVGGVLDAPQFYIDSLAVMTDQEVELVWNGEQAISVLIVDIHEDIDGVLGSDLLTSGWIGFNEEAFDLELTEGPLLASHFDYRNFHEEGDIGTIYFDLNPDFDIVLPDEPTSGDFNNDGVVDAADYVWWRKNGGTQQGYLEWTNSFGEWLNGGGALSRSSTGVPEPASGVLILFASFAACGLASHRKRFTPPARCAASPTC